MVWALEEGRWGGARGNSSYGDGSGGKWRKKETVNDVEDLYKERFV